MSRLVRSIIALFLGVLFVLPSHAQQSSPPDRTVRVSGEATVKVVPDQATVRFGIVSKAETAEAARAQNAEAAKRELREQGVEPLMEAHPGDAHEVMYHPKEFEGVYTLFVEYPHPIVSE